MSEQPSYTPPDVAWKLTAPGLFALPTTKLTIMVRGPAHVTLCHDGMACFAYGSVEAAKIGGYRYAQELLEAGLEP